MKKKLFFLYFNVKCFNLIEEFKVFYKYSIKNVFFLIFDIFFKFFFLFYNPYTVSKKFLMKKKKLNIFTYGETPLTTWDLILKKINIKKKDVLIELGCGRGRLSFWSCYFIKCKIISFEQIYSFCKIANFFKKFFKLKNINFFHANFFHANLSIATVIYFYSIDFHDDDILKMANVFKKLNSSTQIITISFPLTEYLKNDFYVKKSFEVKFPWGKSMAYVQVPVNKDL